jgi:hypothetical protein
MVMGPVAERCGGVAPTVEYEPDELVIMFIAQFNSFSPD